MILRLLKSSNPFIYILFLLIGTLFWMGSLIQPLPYSFFDGENNNVFYYPIFKITAKLPLLQVVLSLVIVLFLAFLIQLINSRYALIKARTKLPIAVFIIFAGGFTTIHTLHPVFFGAIFLLFGINSLFSIFNNPKPHTEIFNAGLFISIGTLFYFNLIVVLPAFLFAISILRRERNWREFLILIFGFVIPALFALSYAFLTDQLNGFFITFQRNIVTPVNYLSNNLPMLGYLILLVLLTLIGSAKILTQYDSMKVSTRKYYLVLLIIFIFSMISFIFVPGASLEMLVVSLLTVTFLVSNLFTSIESGFWRELLFTLLLFSAIFMQFAERMFG
ncbi:MAG: hypothetical protein FD181_274 [Prolixibacteraceae bacterium]|nr:MAG: hypothetical protein FD181_274 [Prolixibacteraceae bacterium]